jgi:hypothetical protein
VCSILFVLNASVKFGLSISKLMIKQLFLYLIPPTSENIFLQGRRGCEKTKYKKVV